MKAPPYLEHKNVIIPGILLIILGILSNAAIYLSLHDIANRPSLKWTGAADRGLRGASVQTRCYNVPYTHAQLKEIAKGDVRKRAYLNRILREETKDEDLSEIIAPPKIVFDGTLTQICLDFKDELEPGPDAFEAHFV